MTYRHHLVTIIRYLYRCCILYFSLQLALQASVRVPCTCPIVAALYLKLHVCIAGERPYKCHMPDCGSALSKTLCLHYRRTSVQVSHARLWSRFHPAVEPPATSPQPRRATRAYEEQTLPLQHLWEGFRYREFLTHSHL